MLRLRIIGAYLTLWKYIWIYWVCSFSKCWGQ